MTPEERREFELLKRTVKSQQEFIGNLSRFERIPLPVSQALGRKLNIRNVPRISASSKSATSEDVTVNESGASTYTVLNDPVGFVTLADLQGNTYEIPYY